MLFSILLAMSCHRPSPSESDVDTDSDTDIPSYPALVLIVTTDTLNRGYLGPNQGDWNTTPNLDVFFQEATTLQNVVATRSLTLVSLTSMHTGLYPRHTGIHENEDEWTNEPFGLFTRFHNAGFRTFGLTTNMCRLVDYDVDERFCGQEQGLGPVLEDEMVIDEFLARLDQRPDPDQPVFAWVHMFQAHAGYEQRQPWLSEFHPDPYSGPVQNPTIETLDAIALNNVPLSEEDLLWARAVYASQVAALDSLIGELFQGLEDRGLYDDAVILYGADHGESLAVDGSYFYHSCSFYDPAQVVTWAVKAPGITTAGTVLEGNVSGTDIGPTIAELGGLDWPEPMDGMSLVPSLANGEIEPHPVFFERGTETAGVVLDGVKYVINPQENFVDCSPYFLDDVGFPGEAVEIYDLVADPDEESNLASSPPSNVDDLRSTLCDWINSDTWISPDYDATSELVAECEE